MLKDYFSWEELTWMPIKDLMGWINFFQPKFQEIAKRQQQERLEAELMQKKMNRVQNRNNLYR